MKIDSIRTKLRVNNTFLLLQKYAKTESEKIYLEHIRIMIVKEITSEETLTTFDNKTNKKPRIKIKIPKIGWKK